MRFCAIFGAKIFNIEFQKRRKQRTKEGNAQRKTKKKLKLPIAELFKSLVEDYKCRIEDKAELLASEGQTLLAH